MGTIYLDIETTGLDYVNDKIVTIQLQENNNQVEIYKSWESSEKCILEKLVKRLAEILNKGFTCCVGFNTLTFDIPFLLSRCIHNEIKNQNELISIFYRKLAHYDIKQILLPQHEWRFKGLNWDYVLDLFGYPTKKGHGSQIPIWFEEKKFEKIISYIESEFPPMVTIYWKLRNRVFKIIPNLNK